MKKICLLTLVFICFATSTYAQDVLYKDELPTRAADTRKKVDSGFANLKARLDHSTYMKYASYKNFFDGQYDLVIQLYNERNYDRLVYQMNYWYKDVMKTIGDDSEMPSTRKANLVAYMEYLRLPPSAMTESFRKFAKAYDAFQAKVYMRRATDSTRIITENYLAALEELRKEIDKSPEKNRMDNIKSQLQGIKSWHELTKFAPQVKGQVDLVKAGRDYLYDETYYSLTLQQKVNAPRWRAENVTKFGESILNAVIKGSVRDYAKSFLSYPEAEKIYKGKYPDFNMAQYEQMMARAEASFNQAVANLKQEAIVPGTPEFISYYQSNSYMNTIMVGQRKTFPIKFDIYILFPTSKGKYLLTVKEVDYPSAKDRLKQLSEIEITPYQ